jgi:hypothetical protein
MTTRHISSTDYHSTIFFPWDWDHGTRSWSSSWSEKKSLSAYKREYGDIVSSLVPILPSTTTARKIAYDEDLISPFSIGYLTIVDIEL